jgi:hypothetical protein
VKSFLAAFLLCVTALSASGATFVVTNVSDSGPGSLRQAIMDANADRTGPAQLITFNIPGPGVQTIAVQSALPALSFGTTIDGYTQPGAKPNSPAIGTNAVLLIEINGSSLPAGQTGITLGTAYGDGQVIRGLVINGFTTNVAVTNFGPHKIVGCYLGTNAAGSATVPPPSGTSVDFKFNPDNFGFGATVGGPAPADRNVVGFEISFGSGGFPPSGSGVIQGNYVGISADGRSFINPKSRITVADLPIQVGGSADGAGNVIAGHVLLAGTDGALVQRNLIGTDATGMVACPGGGGLDLSWKSYFHIAVPARSTTVFRNVIVSADPARSAVVSIGGGTTNTFQQNFIGVAADGKTPLGDRPQGIAFLSSPVVGVGAGTNNTIGGTKIGDGNVIAFAAPNPAGGSQPTAGGVTSVDGRNFIEGNSITGSGGLGIDLGAPGVTPNDAGDQDGIQNHPVLTAVTFANGTVRVKGTLASVANTTFRIEIFGNDAGNPSGYAQGRYYLGFTDVTTDANGNGTFDVTLPVPASVRAVSATATGPSGTSEFVEKPARLKNISTRARIEGTGDHVAIAGFIVSGPRLAVGDVPHILVVRAIGPSLRGIQAPLPDPRLELHFEQAQSASNDNWADDSNASFIQGMGLAPTNKLESALVGYVGGGEYTVVVRDTAGRSGTGLVEIYDVDPSDGREVLNLSTRGFIGTGDDVMIAGTILEPDAGLTEIVARAIGPSLADSGIMDPLADPMLELHDSQGAVIASNDDWVDGDAATLTALGLAPNDEMESAIFVRLPAGAYTATIRGKDGGTGVGLVELYNLH